VIKKNVHEITSRHAPLLQPFLSIGCFGRLHLNILNSFSVFYNLFSINLQQINSGASALARQRSSIAKEIW